MPINKCACCNKPLFYDIMDVEDIFCSTECAIYAGRYSIKDGLINQDQPIKRHPPKRSWNMTDEFYENWLKELGWYWNQETYEWELHN